MPTLTVLDVEQTGMELAAVLHVASQCPALRELRAAGQPRRRAAPGGGAQSLELHHQAGGGGIYGAGRGRGGGAGFNFSPSLARSPPSSSPPSSASYQHGISAFSASAPPGDPAELGPWESAMLHGMPSGAPALVELARLLRAGPAGLEELTLRHLPDLFWRDVTGGEGGSDGGIGSRGGDEGAARTPSRHGVGAMFEFHRQRWQHGGGGGGADLEGNQRAAPAPTAAVQRAGVYAALAGSRSLRSLRLYDVGLDDAAAANLAASLPLTLEELHLGGSGVGPGPRAAAAVGAVLATDARPALWNVSIPGTAVGLRGAVELDAALSRRRASGRALFVRLGVGAVSRLIVDWGQGVRGQGSGVRGQGSGVRGQGPEV
jgi:hypothetical protein